MDNKNEFIHIDELFQKLRHTVQEEYRSEDAWSRMKNLLDEEMPVADPVKGSGRKRYFIPLLALLLGIGGATTGYQYYQYQQQQSTGTQYATTVQDIISNTAVLQAAPVNTATEAPGGLTEYPTTGASRKSPIASNPNNNRTVATDIPTRHINTGTANNKQATMATPTATGIAHIEKDAIASLSNPTDQITTAHRLSEAFQLPVAAAGSGIWQFRNPITRLLADNTAAVAMSDATPDHTGSKPSNERLEKLLQDRTGLSRPAVQQQPSVPEVNRTAAQQAPRTETSATGNEPNIVTNNPQEIIHTVKKDNITYVQKNDGQWYQEAEEKMKFIHTVKKLDENRQYYTDTQSVEENIIVKHLPVDASIVTGKTGNNFSSTASAATASSNFTDLKVLNDSKVKAFSGEKGSAFFKRYILRDDIYKLFNGTNKFEAMINFGGMYAPAATGSYGFHLGIGGLYNLTERLDIGLEARYVRKSFSNFYQEDEQKQYNVSQNGSIFSGTETITNFEYTIRNYNSIEIPLYLSYKIGDRVSIMGGIQYVYAAPIKWQLKTNTSVNDNFASMEMPQNTNTVFNQQADFSARSGLGFMAGIGFDASKRISLDFRVSQNFYGKGNSSNNSINSIYNAPVFGLTLGYFFGKKDKIYYLMQNSKR